MGAFYDLKSGFIGWFGNIKLYKYPMFIVFGHTAYKINGNDQREILNTLQPGDVLLRRYDHYISGLMIPGYFTHSAIYVGDNKVIHMLGDGICEEDILVFMRCDDMAVLRFNDSTKIDNAIKLAKEQLAKGVEYDFDFDFVDAGKFSCTELVHFLFGYPDITRLKSKYLVPDDFKRSILFPTVWRKKRAA